MIILANILAGLAVVLKLVLDLGLILIIARVVVSWVNADPYNPIVRFIYSSTEPMLAWVRRKLPLTFSNIDFTPIIIFALIYFLQLALVQSLSDYAVKIKMKDMGISQSQEAI